MGVAPTWRIPRPRVGRSTGWRTALVIARLSVTCVQRIVQRIVLQRIVQRIEPSDTRWVTLGMVISDRSLRVQAPKP